MRQPSRARVALVALFVLSACAAPPAAPTLTPLPEVIVDYGPPPTNTALPLPSATVAPASTATATPPDLAELAATVVAALPATATPPGDGSPAVYPGIGAVSVITLDVAPGSPPLWAVASSGSVRVEPEPQAHFVAVYTHDASGWHELGRADLECPDLLEDGALSQTSVEPAGIWLAVEGYVGAHSGCFELLRYDGRALTLQLSQWADHPGAGAIEDVDGDGQPDVVLDDTDSYIFCYACGVRLAGVRVMRWNGTALAEVHLERLGGTATQSLRDAVDRAVDLAHAGLWGDAEHAIANAQTFDEHEDPVVAWDAGLIRLMAEARRAAAEESPYPLLGHVFAGNYALAVEELRAYAPDEVFDPETPLVRGTAAEGYEPELAGWITRTATLAVAAQPDNAGAYFMRGWAIHLADPDDPAALDDFQHAVDLQPDDPFFVDCLQYLLRE